MSLILVCLDKKNVDFNLHLISSNIQDEKKIHNS